MGGCGGVLGGGWWGGCDVTAKAKHPWPSWEGNHNSETKPALAGHTRQISLIGGLPSWWVG